IGSGRIRFYHAYNDIISVKNILEAWKEFVKGKHKRKDVQIFERDLMGNIISLHNDLVSKSYEHLSYEFFRIYDPKLRDIHKASVRDRLLHHALYRKLYPFFDGKFIADSFSCRLNKGTHKALDRFRSFTHKASLNNTKTVWILKCDIRKFFASVDQEILIKLLDKHISDRDILSLLSKIIKSFSSTKTGIGLPLGNLTSQLLVNIYMNEFDQYIKHRIRAKYYIRYADDFVIFSHDKKQLYEMLPAIQKFLFEHLRLSLHPNKISICTIASGIDFLGWVHFPDHRVLRTTTKKRMFKNIKIKEAKAETVQSYLGLVSHGNSWNLRQQIRGLANKAYQSV
ncbi:MAG: reverse transcriptase domain-containing protein, partial [Patescibacteria group bacterium]